MHSVRYDLVEGIIRYRLDGFWEVDEVAKFRSALLAEMKRRAAAAPALKLLGDASAFPVQSVEVAAAFETLMLREVLPATLRLALVVSGVLGKLQVRRSGVVANMQMFLDVPAALAWLREVER